MSRTVQRTLMAAVGAAAMVGLFAAPAAAADAGPASAVSCSADLDGGKVCVSTSASPPNRVLGWVQLADGRLFSGVLLVLKACDEAGNCNVVLTKVSAGVNQLSTGTVPWDPGVRYFEVNASWADDQNHLHTGVVAATPHGQ